MITYISLMIIFLIPVLSHAQSADQPFEQTNVLSLTCKELTDDKAIRILNSPQHNNLQYLDLSGNDEVSDSTIKETSHHLSHLKFLKISGTLCTSISVAIITEHLPCLVSLNISQISIDKTTAKEIGEQLTQLKNLRASNCKLSSSSCYYLTDKLRDLENLNIAFNHCNIKGFYGLTMNVHPKLARLNLKYNYISGVDILKLSHSSWFKDLENLNLSRNRIGDFALGFICQELTSLRTLKLCTCGVQDRHALIIADNLSKLRILKLAFNDIGDEGIFRLLKAPMPHLKVLNLIHNSFTNLGRMALKQYKQERMSRAEVYWSEGPEEEISSINSLGTLLE